MALFLEIVSQVIHFKQSSILPCPEEVQQSYVQVDLEKRM